jgi:hypothetical protein
MRPRNSNHYLHRLESLLSLADTGAIYDDQNRDSGSWYWNYLYRSPSQPIILASAS